MSVAKIVLFGLLILLAMAFCFVWNADFRRRPVGPIPSMVHMIIGFVTDFLDTLGIGSFAMSTALRVLVE